MFVKKMLSCAARTRAGAIIRIFNKNLARNNNYNKNSRYFSSGIIAKQSNYNNTNYRLFSSSNNNKKLNAGPTISVDKAKMYQDLSQLVLPPNVDDESNNKTAKKSEMSPLAKELQCLISLSGLPLSVSDFMTACLAHPEYGYYKRKEEKIGKQGDFITAPEISQMFGELLGIWCVSTWSAMGSPKDVRLIEIGPGKGTLMKDVMRAIEKFPAAASAIKSIHMVETSPAFRGVQKETLGVKSEEENKVNNWTVHWHEEFEEIPEEGPILLLGQELLDALPVQQLEYTMKGWRERLVDVDDEKTGGPHHFRFTLAENITPAVTDFLKNEYYPKYDEFNLNVGDGVELCPAGIDLIDSVSKRIQKHGGGALFIDYGEDFAQAETLRGLQLHKYVNVLQEPGEVDISADVDFSTLKRAANSIDGVKTLGPMTQGNFLSGMGIETRLQMLIDKDETNDEQAVALYDSYRRLVDEDQMGRKYKVLAITDDKIKGPIYPFEN